MGELKLHGDASSRLPVPESCSTRQISHDIQNEMTQLVSHSEVDHPPWTGLANSWEGLRQKTTDNKIQTWHTILLPILVYETRQSYFEYGM